MKLLILFFLVLSVNSKSNKHHITEITEENLNQVRKLLRDETDEKQREFLRMILEPEKADLNYDRKISPSELRKFVEKVLLPKGSEASKNLHPEIIKQARDGIELFITNIHYHLNYKQFQELMSRIKTEHFLNIDRASAAGQAKDNNVELTDDL